MLAGFEDGRADEGVGAGPASLLGLKIANERGWVAPGGASGSRTTDGRTDRSDRHPDPDPHEFWDDPQSWTLDTYAAPRRLQALKKALAHGAAGDHRRRQGLEHPRPRRRRLPDRHEVVVHARPTAARATSSSTPTSPSRARARTCRS